jgi:hypothetical protein
MQNIIKAMNETQFKPRTKWWGFVKDDFRYLCRYNHIFACFDLKNKKVVYAKYETITDKRGVEFAVKYFNEMYNLIRK